MRSFDYEKLRPHLLKYPEMFERMDMERWLSNHNNVMLVKGDDIALFTYEFPGLYTGHYLFKSRGKEVFPVAKEMLQYMFDNFARGIQGYVDLDNRKSRWVTRKLGFTSLGIFHDYELFYLSKEQLHG